MLINAQSGDGDYGIYKHLVPTKMQLEELLEKNKPEFEYRTDFFHHLIHLTIEIPAKNKSLRREDGFAHLNAKLLQKKESNYRSYLNYLVSNNILEEKKGYLNGQFSKAFRISKQLLSDGLIQALICDKRLLRSIESEYQTSAADRKKYSYLFKWFNNHLQVDDVNAVNHCLKDVQKNAYEGYHSAFGKMWKINQIKNGIFWFKTDKFGHRLHTNLTNLNSDLFQFLRYDGKPLVALDVKNSQPYFSTKVIEARKANTPSEHTQQDSPIMLLESPETLISIDLWKYKRLVVDGKFYEFMVEKIREEFGDNYFSREFIYDFDLGKPVLNNRTPREMVKADMFFVFFSKNATNHPIKEVFKKHFPTVAREFERIKGNKYVAIEDRHAELAKLLQRLESECILNVACKKIAKHRPDIPLFTIHDCIITTEGNEDFVKQITLECLTEKIGVPPKLEIKYFSNSNSQSYKMTG